MSDSSNAGCLILIVLVVIFGAIQCSGDDPPRAPPVPYTPAPSNAPIRAEAVGQMSSLPGIINAEWVDDTLWLSVRDNGSSWDSVAESSCSWIRSRKMTGEFKVQVVDAAALSNKHVTQLGYAYCN